MAAGSTVSFSVTQLLPGILSFNIHADGATANLLYTAANKVGGHTAESATWQNLLDDVAAFCEN